MESFTLEARHQSSNYQESTSARPSGYAAGPPWIFTGRALYQLHLVKAKIAQQFIPPELRLVQAFGYTLGGLYLAHYDSSPAGPFDELVVIAGTVWNPPTSCAWAARVLVNNLDACRHGRKEVGLPSHIADFKLSKQTPQKQKQPWWNGFLQFTAGHHMLPGNELDLNISEIDGPLCKPLCHLNLPWTWAKADSWRVGPRLRMSLPSFSGRTHVQPHLLQYSCKLNCNVELVKPALVTSTCSLLKDEDNKTENIGTNVKGILSVLTSKPVLALFFERMSMHVEAPSLLVCKSTKMKESK